MARRGGRSPLPPTNSMAYGILHPLNSSHSTSSLRGRSASPENSSFDSTLTFPPANFQHSYDLKLHHSLSQASLLDNSDALLDHHGSGLPQETLNLHGANSPFDLIPFHSGQREPKVSPHTPWNPINASMNTQPEQSLSSLQQNKKTLYTDSGYDSHHSRPISSNHLPPHASIGAGQSLPYDDPLGSAVQQKNLLPDQQRRKTLPNSSTPISPKPPSVIAIEPTTTTSISTSFRCEECLETFNTKSEMSKHVARHSKKFVCDHPGCARSTDGFATKNDLERHKASVHHDSTVARKEYKCSVPGCKDPNKIWDRKDNFKAHVKRMHLDVNIEEVLMRSYQGESLPAPDRALSHSGGPVPDYGQTSMIRQQSNIPYTQPSADGSNYHPAYYGMNQNTLEEEDMYGPSSAAEPRPLQYSHQLDVSGIPNANYSQFPNMLSSVTAGPSNYTSSNTMAQQTNVQDNPRPVFAHRAEFPSPFRHGDDSQPQMRPLDVQTAPIVGHNQDDFQSRYYDLSQHGDNSSVADGGMSTIDPSLQTGSWDIPSQSGGYAMLSDMSDHQLQSDLNLANDEQSVTNPAIDQRLQAVWQQLESILKPVSPGDLKVMVDTFGNHPPVHGKSSCAIQRAISVIANGPRPEERPWRCSRDGCGKTFTQKNIKTKHEQRHDRLFFCTFDGCYSTFGSKDDLRRHEQRKHDREVFEGFRCFAGDVPTSLHRPDCSKFFDDIEAFKQHRREEHRERAGVNNGGLKALRSCLMKQGIPGPFWCGFCQRVIPNDNNPTDGTLRDKNRYDHIDQHIKREKRNMDSWVDIRSEGLTKTEVKRRTAHHTPQEDSQEEGDVESQTPELSHTVGNTGSHVPPQSNRHLGVSTTDSRYRKRAHSDAEATQPVEASYKVPRLANYQAPRQAPSMSRALTGMAALSMPTTSRLGLLLPNAQVQPPSNTPMVKCCTCGARHPFDGEVSCGVNGCFHKFCQSCAYFNNTGQQIFPTSTTRGL